ncbi:MAG TPA: hypothetical protein VKX29_06270 [Brumimicrobium sp.]|nr:hypothetical protein [Brumimicrobium sp.]
MKITIKYLFSLYMVFCISLAIGQESSYEEPPRQENTYLFEVLNYDRQPKPPTYIYNRILQIHENPMTHWTSQDSLFYAYESVHLESFDLALTIFTRLNTDTISETHAKSLYRTALFKTKRYKALSRYNEKTIKDNPSAFYSVKEAFRDLNNAYIAYQNKTFIPDSTVIFPVLKDPALEEMKRNVSPHKNRLVEIAFAIDSAFRQFTILHDDQDYILSQAFKEMGDFQREYFYLTNAYFYYSASRHYNKNDKNVVVKYNQVIDKMNKQRLLFISFKNRFGKVIKDRYRLNEDYIEEAEKQVFTKEDYIAPPKKKIRKDYLPWVDNSILIMIVLGLALVFVLLFMKVKN